MSTGRAALSRLPLLCGPVCGITHSVCSGELQVPPCLAIGPVQHERWPPGSLVHLGPPQRPQALPQQTSPVGERTPAVHQEARRWPSANGGGDGGGVGEVGGCLS